MRRMINQTSQDERVYAGPFGTHLRFRVKPVSPQTSGVFQRDSSHFLSTLQVCCALLRPYCTYNFISYFSLNGVAEAFPLALQTSLLLLRNNPWSGCSLGHLNFPPFIGHFSCSLVMTAAVLKGAACVCSGRKQASCKAGAWDPIRKARQSVLLTGHILGFPGRGDKKWDSKANIIGFSKCPMVQGLRVGEIRWG